MITEPTPRHIAHAIADLASPLVQDSWRYLDTWSALDAGGVPGEQIRDVLDRKLVDTEALTEARGWRDDGERGLLVEHGAQDCGKTFAAAWWAYDRHTRGLPTMWISAAKWGRLTFDEIRPMLRRAESADALVIDDAGCGASQGEFFRRTIEALLLERGDRPTLITGNLNELEMVAWLGGRVTSRLKVSGGRKHIAQSLGMRQRDLSIVCPKTGHGEAWERAAELLAVFGCERTQAAVMRTEYDDEGGSWDVPTGEYRERFDVGRMLEVKVMRAASDKGARAACMAATKLAGLDDRKVWAHAVELVGTVSDLDGADVLASMTARLAEQMTEYEAAAAKGRREENEYRAKVCYGALEEMSQRNRSLPRPAPASTADVPKWTRGPSGIKAMQAQGYYLRDRTDGVDLYRKRKGSADQLVVMKCANPAEGWQACRLLWGSGW